MFSAAAQHADEFLDTGFALNREQARASAALSNFLLDHEMQTGGGGHLWKVSDGDHLVAGAQRGHLATHCARDFTTNIGVNFIEDHQGCIVLIRQSCLEREHDARNFT